MVAVDTLVHNFLRRTGILQDCGIPHNYGKGLLLADKLSISRRKMMSPIRVLIEATLPEADLKQKSRWVRALEYVYSENVSRSQFRRIVRTHGGIAGCAGPVVNVNRKRKRPGGDCIEGDWDD